jgi:hypothetical protein
MSCPQYEVEVDGGEPLAAKTITKCRHIAESHGKRAISAMIYRRGRNGRTLVAAHRRSQEGDGLSWYKACI